MNLHHARCFRAVSPSLFRFCNARALGILAPSVRCANEKIAVLYQAVEPPVVNGVRKPKKPGGQLHFHFHRYLAARLSVSERLPRLRSRHLLRPPTIRPQRDHTSGRALPTAGRRMVLPRYRTRHPCCCPERLYSYLGQHNSLRQLSASVLFISRQTRLKPESDRPTTSTGRRVRRQELRQLPPS